MDNNNNHEHFYTAMVVTPGAMAEQPAMMLRINMSQIKKMSLGRFRTPVYTARVHGRLVSVNSGSGNRP